MGFRLSRSLKEIRRKSLDKCRIGLVTLRGIPYGHITDLKRLLPEADLAEFGPSFNRIRRVCQRGGINLPQTQRILTDLASIALEQRLHPGMNEQEVLGVIYDAYLKHGGDPGIHFIASTRWTSPTGLSLGSAQPKESWRLAASSLPN